MIPECDKVRETIYDDSDRSIRPKHIDTIVRQYLYIADTASVAGGPRSSLSALYAFILVILLP